MSSATLSLAASSSRAREWQGRYPAILLAVLFFVSGASLKDVLPFRMPAGAVHPQDLFKALVFLTAGCYGIRQLQVVLRLGWCLPAALMWLFGGWCLASLLTAHHFRFAALGTGLLGLMMLFTPTALAALGRQRVLQILLPTLVGYLLTSTAVYLCFPSHTSFHDSESVRLAGLTHSNGMGQFAGLMLICAICLYEERLLSLRKLLLCLALGLVVLVWAQGRMPTVAAILAISVYLFRKGTMERTAILRSVVVVGTLGCLLSTGIFVWVSYPKKLLSKDQSLLSRSGEKNELKTLTGRDVIWKFALDKIEKRPLQGYGYGCSLLLYAAAYDNEDLLLNFGSAHNVILESALNTGWVGAGLVGLSLVSLLVLALRQPCHFPDMVVIFLSGVGVTEAVLFGPVPGPTTLCWILALHWRLVDTPSTRNSLVAPTRQLSTWRPLPAAITCKGAPC